MAKQRGIKRLGRGLWQVYASMKDPRRPNKRKELKRICEGTEADAQAMRLRLLDELRSGAAFGTASRMTLAAFARSWLERKAASLKPSTLHKYGSDLVAHIYPALGDLYIDAITPADVAAFIADQLAGRTVTRKAYGPRTVAQRLRMLRMLARAAHDDGITSRNFTGGVKIPAGASLTPYSEDDPNLLSAPEMRLLMSEIPAHWYALTATMLLTGMRWSEATALKWSAVDTEAMTVTIAASNWRGIIGTPKTDKSRRIVPITPELAEILRRHRRSQIERQSKGLAAGWVFPARSGTPYRSYPLGDVLRAALRRAGVEVPIRGSHALRRTCNDLTEQHASGRAARGLLGHSTVEMTARYSVVRLDERRRGAQAVADLLHKAEDCAEASEPPPGYEWENASDSANNETTGIQHGA